MNMNMEDKTVYLTMTYELLEGALPKGWKDIKPVWFDAAQCGTSEVSPPQQSGKFVVTRFVNISSNKFHASFLLTSQPAVPGSPTSKA
jgi:hypothetical protein